MRILIIIVFLCIASSACVNRQTDDEFGTVFNPLPTDTENIVSFKQGNQPVCSWSSGEDMYTIVIIEGDYAATINSKTFDMSDWSSVFAGKKIYSVSDYKERLTSPYVLGSEKREGDETETITFDINASYTVYVMKNHLTTPEYTAVSIIGTGRKFYLSAD